MKKNIKGITLVSLVITIIVMLILAGVSISMATGNNGVLTRGQQASKRTNISSIQEDLTLAVTSVQSDYEAKWAMDSTFASKKATYVTITEMNKYLTKCKILTGTVSGSATTVEATFGDNKITVYPTGTALSTICGAGGVTSPADSTANCGKKLGILFLSNGKDSTTLGNSLYVALYYMENGMPTFVDVGLCQKTFTTNQAKTGVIHSGTASEINAALTCSDNSEMTWLVGKEATALSLKGTTD